MEVQEVDVADDVVLRVLYDAMVAASDREYASPLSWAEYRASAQMPDPWTRLDRVLVRTDEGVVVAGLELAFSQRDNINQAWLRIHVVPAYVTTDLGLAAVDLTKQRAQAAGRRVLQTAVEWDVDQPSSPRRDLLERGGFVLGLSDLHQVLDLPVDPDRLDDIARAVEPHHRAYSLVAWQGPCPERLIDGFARLRSKILTEAPMGDLEFEDEDFGPDRVRHEEAELVAQGRESYTAVALTADQTVVGQTQLLVSEDPVHAHQWDTLVLGEHRGHRLGLALKARNLQEAATALAGRRLLHTWNAQANTPMVRVNDQLGFRVAEYSGLFQCAL